jgi:hypothetical protein
MPTRDFGDHELIPRLTDRREWHHGHEELHYDDYRECHCLGPCTNPRHSRTEPCSSSYDMRDLEFISWEIEQQQKRDERTWESNENRGPMQIMEVPRPATG